MSLVSTEISHVQRALELYRVPELWIGIGKTSAWGNPDVPPLYDPINLPANNIWWTKATVLTEPIGYRRVTTRNLVIKDPNGIIETIDESGNSQKWSAVLEADAPAQGAKYLYVATTLDNSLPFDTFRQTGLFSYTTKNVGVPSGRTYLIPSEVLNPGILEVIQNHAPQPRSANSRQKVQFVYEL